MSAKLCKEKQALNHPPLLGGLDTVREEIELSENVARDSLQEDVGTTLLPAFDVSPSGSRSPTVMGTTLEDEPLTEVRIYPKLQRSETDLPSAASRRMTLSLTGLFCTMG